jgi:hypothetical protein
MRLLGANVATNAASIVFDGTGSALYSDLASTEALAGFVDNRGAFTVRNGRDYPLTAGFENRGAVTVGSGSVLTATGPYVQKAGITTVQGTLNSSADSVRIEEGTLAGTGIVEGDVFVGGTTSPGASVGQLTVDGDFTSDSSARFLVDIEGPGQVDLLTVSGNAAYGGVIDVVLPGPFIPSLGDSFLVSTFATRSGSFSGVVGCPAPGTCFEIAYSSGGVYLVAVSSGVTGIGDEPGPEDAPLILGFSTRSSSGGMVALALEMPEPADVSVAIFDIEGRRIAVVREGYEDPGRHRFEWYGDTVSGRRVSSGVYFARAVVRTSTGTRILRDKVVMIR